MCAIRRGCCEGRVPEKCLKIIGARAGRTCVSVRACMCECECGLCVGRLEGGMNGWMDGWMDGRDVEEEEERWPERRTDEEETEERNERNSSWVGEEKCDNDTERGREKSTLIAECDKRSIRGRFDAKQNN